jgi:6-pyruvoyltetrahydropterin/6-carboxytetrahydropterin synthase
MSKIRITKEFSFEMAHALKDYQGKCENIHGHSYHLAVTIIGNVISTPSPKLGMVLDFGDLKKIVRENIVDVFDHVLVLNETDSRKEKLSMIDTKLILTSYQPTAENLMLDFVDRIKDKLPPDVSLHSLKLRETATSFVEWFASDD